MEEIDAIASDDILHIYINQDIDVNGIV